MTTPLAVEGPGVLPALAAPRDAAELSTVVRDAAARRTRLRVVAGGTWLDAGHPVHADAVLPLGALAGIVDYVPGDLTLTARAGTPLAALAQATAAEGQLLALDPFGDARGTLGATVATASAGPLAHAFGTPRDNVIGATFVDGEGRVVRAGGRVVKNVAGFDLVRLVTGAWGTLGVLAEVSVRLRPRPEVDATVALAAPALQGAAGPAALGAWLAGLRTAALTAWSLELVNGALAQRLGVADRPVVLARLAGNAELVSAQRATLAAHGDLADVPDDTWERLRTVEPRAATVVRLSARPTRLMAVAGELFTRAAAAVGLLAHATVDRGVARLILPGETGFGLPRLADTDATVIVERAPAAVRPALGEHGLMRRAADPLARALHARFDPAGVLNPGVLGVDP